jgi:prepilin-type processing-associated H-X9-DG protein
MGEALLIPALPFSYGYNAHGMVFSWGFNFDTDYQLGLGAFLWPDNPAARATEMKATRVKLASEMIAVADTGEKTAGVGLCGSHGSDKNWPGTVHRGGANVLFCDGHVQWYALTDLVGGATPGGPSPAAVRNRRMWNNNHATFVQ